MISRIRERLGPAGFVVAVVALVAALAGGAYAASGGLSGKQKKEVEKISKKFAGKPGATGPQGPAGANGKDGTNGTSGKDGTNGTNGAPGTNGKSVEVGTATVGECTEGGATVQVTGEAATKKPVCNGSPWTAGGTLPSEATETGVWRFISNGEQEQFVPISFPIPLSGVDAENITFESRAKEAPPTANCPGTPEEPEAEPGFLCVYASALGSNFFGNPRPTIYKPVFSGEEPGVATSGALLLFESEEASHRSAGSFAITAP